MITLILPKKKKISNKEKLYIFSKIKKNITLKFPLSKEEALCCQKMITNFSYIDASLANVLQILLDNRMNYKV